VCATYIYTPHITNRSFVSSLKMDHANGPTSRLTISLPQPSPLQFELNEDDFPCEPNEGDGSTTAPIFLGTRVEQLQRPRHFSFGNAPKTHSKGAVGMKFQTQTNIWNTVKKSWVSLVGAARRARSQRQKNISGESAGLPR